MCVALREGKEAIFGSCVLQNRFADLVLIFQKVKEHLIMRIIIKTLFRGMNCWQQFSNVWGFCFVFWRWFHVAQTGFRFTVYLRMTLNS